MGQEKEPGDWSAAEESGLARGSLPEGRDLGRGSERLRRSRVEPGRGSGAPDPLASTRGLRRFTFQNVAAPCFLLWVVGQLPARRACRQKRNRGFVRL